jgi:hypothetical protein
MSFFGAIGRLFGRKEVESTEPVSISERQAERIAERLTECGAMKACGTCGIEGTKVIVRKVVRIYVNSADLSFDMSGLRAVAVLCNHCGEIRCHSLAMFYFL